MRLVIAGKKNIQTLRKLPYRLNLHNYKQLGLLELRSKYLWIKGLKTFNYEHSFTTLNHTNKQNALKLRQRRYAIWVLTSKLRSSTIRAPRVISRGTSHNDRFIKKLNIQYPKHEKLSAEVLDLSTAPYTAMERYSMKKRNTLNSLKTLTLLTYTLPVKKTKLFSKSLTTLCFFGHYDRRDALQVVYRSSIYSAMRALFIDQLFKLTASAMHDFVIASNKVACTDESTYDIGEQPVAGIMLKTKQEFAALYGPELVQTLKSNIFLVRFKPGYLKFFAELRQDYALTNNLSFTRDQRLTKYVFRFKNMSNNGALMVAVLTLETILVSARMCATTRSASKLIESGCVFINGRLCINPKFYLQEGDIVFIKPSYLSFVRVRGAFLRRLRLLQAFSGKYQLHTADVSTTARSYPKLLEHYDFSGYKAGKRITRVINAYTALHDTAAFLEIDYLSLSIAIINVPTRLRDYNYLLLRKSALAYIKMLNWKYIT